MIKRGAFVIFSILISASFLVGCTKPPEPFVTVRAGYQIKNVILFIADGAGSNHYASCDVTYPTATYSGWVKTQSLTPANVWPTDSAAAATAMAYGEKVLNEQVGIVGKQNITEHFHAAGKQTAIMTTDDMWGATPAGFSACAANRNDYADIRTSQMATPHYVDYFMGGFNAVDYGDYYGDARFHSKLGTAQNPMDGLLLTMVNNFLGNVANTTTGFFLMAENEDTDTNSHAQNLPGMKAAMIDFNNAVHAALSWAQNRRDTLIIVTSDHECGGLTLQNGEYAYTLGDHTAVNVPIWLWGARLSKSIIDNTEIFKLLKTFA